MVAAADDRERVARFICGATGLAKDAATWLEHNPMRMDEPTGSAWIAAARTRAERYLATIGELRGLLEGVQGAGPFLTIEPGNWQIDFNGDGTVSPFERYLFWVPKRDAATGPFQGAATDEAYRRNYVNPTIAIDRSDVYWAIAYLDFAEAALNVALAYDWAPARYEEATLRDPARIAKVAYARMRAGIRYSMRLRDSLLAERHDRDEWIHNPRQVNTTFPMRMDAQTFATWGEVLREFDALLAGKALLGGRVDNGPRGGGLRDLSFGLCADGEGLDVRDIFLNPVSRLFDTKQLKARCAKPTPARPLTRLAAIVKASLARNANAPDAGASGEGVLLRHLYWVN